MREGVNVNVLEGGETKLVLILQKVQICVLGKL